MQKSSFSTDVDTRLMEFLQKVREALAENLISAVLFGSAAEESLRITSDVNLLLLLRKFSQSEVDLIRDSFRSSHALIHLEVMFLLESEKERAMNAFSVKFSDILSRRRVLFGPDPFASCDISTTSLLHRTQQVLLNLVLRMRERYVLVSHREEQISFIIADVIGPLRACAGAIQKLEGAVITSPKKALSTLVSESGKALGDDLFAQIDRLRQQGTLPTGTTAKLLFSLIEIAQYLYERTVSSGNFKEEEARV